MNYNILFVLPPMPFIRQNAMTIAEVQKVLNGLGHSCKLFDAGTDFFNHFLMEPDYLRQALVLLEKRLAEKDRDPHWDLIKESGPAILSSKEKWRERIAMLPSAMAGLRSEAFFEPARAAAFVQLLHHMLDLMSTAYAPCRFTYSGFHHPRLNHPSDLKAFTRASTLNPFVRYGLTQASALEKRRPFDLILFFLTSAGQVGPAASLGTSWRKQMPDLMFIAVGLPQWASAVQQAIGGDKDLASPPGMKALWETLQAVFLRKLIPEAGRDSMMDLSFLLPDGVETSVLFQRLQEDKCREVALEQTGREEKTLAWFQPRGELKTITDHLYTLAKKGFWNHLEWSEIDDSSLVAALQDFAATNPNIIHSWCRRLNPPSMFSDPLVQWPEGNAPYGETEPLPGRPFWQVLQNPTWLDAYRQKIGAKRLIHMQLDTASKEIYELGSQLVYHYVPPADLPHGYLDEICRMVEAGGSVSTQWVRHNLERAYLIGYVEERGVVVGNSSLKHPRNEYLDVVSEQSGLDLRHYLERGYTSVRPEYRGFGIGAKLLFGLTKRTEGYKIFSIIGEENVATQKMAVRNRTRKVTSFMSKRAGKSVGVWVPEWMLPEDLILPSQPEIYPPFQGSKQRKGNAL